MAHSTHVKGCCRLLSLGVGLGVGLGMVRFWDGFFVGLGRNRLGIYNSFMKGCCRLLSLGVGLGKVRFWDGFIGFGIFIFTLGRIRLGIHNSFLCWLFFISCLLYSLFLFEFDW